MIEVGDWLRDRNGWEGQVTAVDGDLVTRELNDRSTTVDPVAELEYNTWDAKYPLHT